MGPDQLKRKLKDIKQVEIAIRFKRSPMREGARLIWNEFFTIKPGAQGSARYPFDELLRMSHEQLKAIINDYFSFVYFQYYRENGLSLENTYEPGLLAALGLPPGAGSTGPASGAGRER